MSFNVFRLYERRRVRKPLITNKNRLARFKFVREQLQVVNKRLRVICCSMMKATSNYLVLMEFNGYVVKKMKDICYQIPTMKHGDGNIIVWDCFSNQDIDLTTN